MQRYFFDLLISDIPAAINNALFILYHGSSNGAFGRKTGDRVDLQKIHVIKVQITHTTRPFLSNDYEFNLVFYSKRIADSIWDPACRNQKSELKTLTRRVLFGMNRSLNARRLIDKLLIRQEHKVYFAKYEKIIIPDNTVPLSYHNELFDLFEVYVMRTPVDFPLVRSLFKAQGLDMAERKIANYHTKNKEQIVVYTLKNDRAFGLSPVIVEEASRSPYFR